MLWQLSAQECRGLLALCISDVNKLLLINSPGVTALLVMHPGLLLSQYCPPLPNTTRAVVPSPQTSGLLLDPEHPRKDTAEPVKAAVQRDIAESIQQLAVFPQACEVLKADSELIDAVKALVDQGWTKEAKETAARTLAIFHPEHFVKFVVDEDSLHIMMSCKHSVFLLGPVPAKTG
eukprot:COSAG06_NODE_2959_length_6025_cov_2.863145_1_plen_177_part_00